MNSGKPGGVDLYVGGTEHAVLHLLYARFWHKVLFDHGLRLHARAVPAAGQPGADPGRGRPEDVQEPRQRGQPGRGHRRYGADSLRLYEMFMGPLEQVKPWSMAGVQGVARFLARVWRLVMEEDQEGRWNLSDAVQNVAPTASQQRAVHAAIKKVTARHRIALSFNTAISAMMVCTNELTAASIKPVAALRAFAPNFESVRPASDRRTERNPGSEILYTEAGCSPGGSGLNTTKHLLVQDEDRESPCRSTVNCVNASYHQEGRFRSAEYRSCRTGQPQGAGAPRRQKPA